MGRRSECGRLDRFLADVRVGRSRALVLRGAAGVGKTVLLEYLAGRAAESGCRVAQSAGVHSETELAFAGLHQLCAPWLDPTERLSAPQREALATAFGISAGPPPDRFLVGLAVLSLLSDAVAERPLIALIDDAQWLDRASAQVLGFVARRLAADPVGLVFAARVPDAEMAGIPELPVEGLREHDARALLDSALTAPLDERVRNQIVAETRGNPLALLELPRGLSPAELAGGFGLPAAVPLSRRIEDSFARQFDALPAQTRRLLTMAAADPTGDPRLAWRAAGLLGVSVQAANPAVEAGLVEFGSQVRFRHPLARSAAYRSASVPERQQVHAALAEATDPARDPERRAWHRAAAAAGPDEELAAGIERSVGRAQVRGGLAAAAAFFERSVALTVDPARRAGRTLAAAQASMQAGVFGRALELVAAAEAGPLDELASARVDLLRGQIAFASGTGRDAPPPLLKAAKRLEPLDLDLARETYLNAWGAVMFAGHFAGAGNLLEISRTVRALPALAHPPRVLDLLLDGLALTMTDGQVAAAPTLRKATSAFASAGAPVEERLRWGWLVQVAPVLLWDEDGWRTTVVRQAQLAREAGALDQLPIELNAQAIFAAWSGDFPAAASLIAEADAVCKVTGARLAPHAAMLLACLRGREAEAVPLIRSAIEQAEAQGQGIAVQYARWVTAVLYNGLGRHQEALTAARQASEDAPELYLSMWALPELIEAAARTGHTQLGASALDQLVETTRAGGTEWGLGSQARSRALLSDGQAAEGWYQEAIDRLSRTQLCPELGRAHLLYGEWLRRQGRSMRAREELRTAHGMLAAIGMEAFADRARRELDATGKGADERPVETPSRLSAREALIARLARDGRTNPEIGAQLFLSARTVEWHMSKVLTKLGITSRRQLGQALSETGICAADAHGMPPAESDNHRGATLYSETSLRQAFIHTSGLDLRLIVKRTAYPGGRAINLPHLHDLTKRPVFRRDPPLVERERVTLFEIPGAPDVLAGNMHSTDGYESGQVLGPLDGHVADWHFVKVRAQLYLEIEIKCSYLEFIR